VVVLFVLRLNAYCISLSSLVNISQRYCWHSGLQCSLWIELNLGHFAALLFIVQCSLFNGLRRAWRGQ